MENKKQHAKSETHNPVTITFGLQHARKYARFLLIENGFDDEVVAALLDDHPVKLPLTATTPSHRSQQFVTQDEAADMLRRSTRHVRKLVREGDIPVAFHEGRRPFYDVASIHGYVSGLAHARGRSIVANTRSLHDAEAA
jgi:hypothetical protein